MLTNNGVMPKGATRLGPATLHGYGWEMLMFANAYRCPGKSFTGVLWEIDDEILYTCDRREGYPRLYTRVEVEVIHNDQPMTAWVYTLTDDSRPWYAQSGPSAHYADTVSAGFAFDNLEVPAYNRQNETITDTAYCQ